MRRLEIFLQKQDTIGSAGRLDDRLPGDSSYVCGREGCKPHFIPTNFCQRLNSVWLAPCLPPCVQSLLRPSRSRWASCIGQLIGRVVSSLQSRVTQETKCHRARHRKPVDLSSAKWLSCDASQAVQPSAGSAVFADRDRSHPSQCLISRR